MIKLIATDIDGTLLRSDQSQPEELEAIIKELEENQIIFALASGRSYLSLLDTFQNNNILYIADNGAHVTYKNMSLSLHTLNQATVDELLKVTKKLPHGRAVLTTTNGAYASSEDPAFITEARKYYPKLNVVPDLSAINQPIVKFTICDLSGAEKNSYPYFEEFKDKLQISIAGYLWIDMMIKGVNKGAAIKEIQESYQISEKETMVFGDYLNDIEMMQSAYYSYAMENAHPELFTYARFKADPNDKDGVILKIKEMLHNNLIPYEI